MVWSNINGTAFQYRDLDSNPLYCCSVTKLCLTVCDTRDCSMPGSPVLHYLPEFAQIHFHWISDVIEYLILCHALFLTSIFPNIRVFSNEVALHIRWPKCWSFSVSQIPIMWLISVAGQRVSIFFSFFIFEKELAISTKWKGFLWG